MTMLYALNKTGKKVNKIKNTQKTKKAEDNTDQKLKLHHSLCFFFLIETSKSGNKKS